MAALTKAELRKSFLQKRIDMPESERKSADKRIYSNFFENVVVPKGALVSGYCPIKAEADILPILVELRVRGHKCLLPRTIDVKKPLEFVNWDENALMRSGNFGIAEPDGGEILIPDIILTPLLAFTGNMSRIGYGKGLYDRTIAYIKEIKPVFIIGIGYEFQKADFLPTEETDMLMDMVVTDCGVYI